MLMTTDIDWVVISLRRTPERMKQFTAVNAHAGVPFETFDAVDGKELDRKELERSGLVTADLTWGPGAIGAALSQRQCWLRAIETGRSICIFEDDVFLRGDFAARALGAIDALPKDWDTIHFGFNTDSMFDVEMFPGCDMQGGFTVAYPSYSDCMRFVAGTGDVSAVRSHTVFGTCAYAISPGGAQKLLDGCYPLMPREIYIPVFPAVFLPRSNDISMNGLYRDMASYVCLPPIAMPMNDRQNSTIWAT